MAFEYVDITADPARKEEMVRLTGLRSVPVIVIGDQVLDSFDRRRISELLGLPG